MWDFARRMVTVCRSVLWGALPGLTWAVAGGAPVAEHWRLDDQMVDVWETADGLPQNSVNAVTQTRDGYLWIGTDGGLACFDGLRFRRFDSRTTPDLRSDRITALCAEPDGGLWIGTAGGGACHLRHGKFRVFTTAEGLANDSVTALAPGGDGTMWIGTAGGLNIWRDGRLGRVEDDGMPVTALCPSSGAAPWLLRNNQVTAAGTPGAQPLPGDTGADDPPLGLAAGADDNLWVFGHSLVRVSARAMTAVRQEPGVPPGDFVTAVCERGDGTVWLGTRGGALTRLGNRGDDEPAVPSSVGRRAVRCLFEDRELNLWVGLEHGGLVRIKPRQVRTLGRRDGLPGEHITGMCADGDRGFWVGCHAAGLAHWRNGRIVPFEGNDRLPQGCVVWSVLRTRDGGLWIGTEGAGLLRWQDGRIERPAAPTETVPLTAIRALAETPDGSLWFGGAGAGLGRITGQDIVRYGPAEGFEAHHTTVIAGDRKDGVWIGTTGSGLYHFSDGKFRRFTRADGLGSDEVRALFAAADGDLWIGTTGGLSRLRDGRLATLDARHGLWDDAVSVVLADGLDPAIEGGQLWLGSNRGVFRIGVGAANDCLAGKIPRVEPVAYGRAEGMDCLECASGFGPAGLMQEPTENPHTRTMLLWFPTLRGVARLDVFPLTNRARGISGDHLTFSNAWLRLEPDGTRFDLGDVVAGGDGFGTGRAAGIIAATGALSANPDAHNRSDPGPRPEARYHRVDLPFVDGVFIPDGGAVPDRRTVVSSTGITAEFPDTTGEAWGLIKSGLRQFPMDVFNPSEMQELGVPMVWLSGNQGITFDLAAIRRATGKSTGRFTARACNLHIGPASFHVLVDGATVAKRAGMIHDNENFRRGIVALDIPLPRDARFLTLVATDDKDEPGCFNRTPPAVTIEEVRADGVALEMASSPGAAHGDGGALHPPLGAVECLAGAGRLAIHYAGASLVAPEKVRYRHRLEPLEAGWVEAGEQRVASYANLAPGSYRFIVTACNNDGVWNTTGATVTVTLQPRFWETWWFAPLWLSALALLIAGMTAALLRARHRRQIRHLEQTRAIAMERTRIARDIHDDLGAGLTHVALLTDLVRNELADPGPAKGHLDEVFTVARRLARGVDEIVWAINPKNDALELSLNYITKTAQDFLRAAGVACRLDWPESLPPGTLTSAQRHHLYLAVREALNNVVKHAAATEVGIRWSATATGVAVEISDNGRGFTPPPAGAPAARHGLGGMAGRMADAAGALEITSSPGQGTRVRLWLPLQRSMVGA